MTNRGADLVAVVEGQVDRRLLLTCCAVAAAGALPPRRLLVWGAAAGAGAAVQRRVARVAGHTRSTPFDLGVDSNF